MSALFHSPKIPKQETAPNPPTQGTSQAELDAAAKLQAQAMQRGRSATMLTGGSGLSDLGSTSKVLLGS